MDNVRFIAPQQLTTVTGGRSGFIRNKSTPECQAARAEFFDARSQAEADEWFGMDAGKNRVAANDAAKRAVQTCGGLTWKLPFLKN